MVLFTGLNKMKQYSIDQFSSAIEKYIEEILQKVPGLTDTISENFQLDDHNEDGLNYKVLSEEKLKKI